MHERLSGGFSFIRSRDSGGLETDRDAIEVSGLTRPGTKNRILTE